MAILKKIDKELFYQTSKLVEIELIKRVFSSVVNGLSFMDNLVNSKENKDHEQSFIDFLLSIGFTELHTISTLDIYREDVDILGNIHYMPHLSDTLAVVHEPYGSQDKPDFILIIYGFIVYIEFKSSKSNKIMWNSAYAIPDWIYVYSNSKKNTTILFLGSDITSEEDIILIEEFKLEYRRLTTKYIEKFKALGSAWSPYPRIMLDNTQTIVPEFEQSVIQLINERVQYAKPCDYALYTKHSCD